MGIIGKCDCSTCAHNKVCKFMDIYKRACKAASEAFVEMDPPGTKGEDIGIAKICDINFVRTTVECRYYLSSYETPRSFDSVVKGELK